MVQENQIIQQLSKLMPVLKKDFHVKRLAVFGSVADGSFTQDSDVDLFIEFEQSIGLRFFDLVDFLEKKLGRSIDLLTSAGMKSIRPSKVAEHIKQSFVYV